WLLTIISSPIADILLTPLICLSTYRCSSRQAAVVLLSDERLAGKSSSCSWRLALCQPIATYRYA
ncbi:hypothetical protein, partial [Gluconobacter sp.]|uniref:hypothetical protein n=1 Tax=Gluconobacter sp. TaxID=1876758 RepID=UPI0039E7EC49